MGCGDKIRNQPDRRTALDQAPHGRGEFARLGGQLRLALLHEGATAAAARQQQPIHDEQEKLAAALKDIQEHHGAQGADKTRLEGAIKNALAASDKVHVAADANDFAKVDSSLKTLQATMGLLEKQINPAAK